MAERDHIAGLPVFTADAAAPGPAFEPGAPFWRAVDRLATTDLIYGQLDELLAGAMSPRIWLLVHEPTRGELSATAALMLARSLTARGQDVLVLDVDEAGAALTIWAEREETEGWIDVARFGASVTTASVPLPFRGARGELLGVGSFSPTDVSEDEIVALLGRLRHHADDIVLVGMAGPQVLPWARRAQRRLLCWDRAARSAERLAPVLGPFASAGAPLTGLVAYGTEAAERAVAAPGAVEPALAAEASAEQQVAAEIAEIAEAVPAVANEHGDETAAAMAADPATDAPLADELPADEPPADEAPAAEPVVLGAAAGDEMSDRDPAGEAPPGARPAGPLLDAGVDLDKLVESRFVPAPDSDLGSEPEAARGTPRLFWLAAAVFSVALVAVAWYWATHVRIPRGGFFEPVVTQAPRTDALDLAKLDTATFDVAAIDTVVTGQTSGGQTAAPSSQTGAGATGPGPDAAPAAGAKPTVPADAKPATPAGAPPAGVAQAGGLTSFGDTLPGGESPRAAGAPATQVRPASPDGPVPFDAAAYAVPAGQAGWALHVFSQADSVSAAKQAAELERAGYRVTVRIVEIKDKGRWWRLYLGSFPSRAAARAAMPALLERLRASWAEPARIQD